MAIKRILLLSCTAAVIAATLLISGTNIFRTSAQERRRGDKPWKTRTASEIERPATIAATNPVQSLAPDTSDQQGTFSNTANITINDHAIASPYPSAITVSGLSGNIASTVGSVAVTMNGFSHTFPDDVGIVLVGPTGAAMELQDGVAEVPVSNVNYTISDAGTTPLPDETAIINGTVYKPASYYQGDSFPAPGPGTSYGTPATAGSDTIGSIFNGTNPNGTWNLYIVDFVDGDAGTISGGWSISITTADGVTHVQHVVDFDGDGKTDFAVVRNTGGGSSGQTTWFVGPNGTNNYTSLNWGIATDFFVPADYDGDHKTDYAVWRPISSGQPSGNAYFYIFQSQTSTVRVEDFGQTGDDPSVVGDYDGDGKADPAVYRGGASSGSPSFWYYRTTPGGGIFNRQWGQNGDFPAPGDYDGDSKYDFAIQRNGGGGNAKFWIHTAAGAESVTQFGTPTDVIVPGDYDGDGKTDIAIVRGSGGQFHWWYLPSGGGAAVETIFGASATDFICQGDYDGDGKTDPGIWRPDVAQNSSRFWYMGTMSGTGTYAFGQNGDYPVANYNSH